jgi:hypothetical protein
VNVAIEMHDSELVSVGFDEAGSGSVLLRAYVHRTPGEPGVSSGEGGVQLVRIIVEQMEIEGNVGELPSYIYEGSLLAGDILENNMVPFPAEYGSSVRLKMMLSEDARVVTVSGNGATIKPEGEFEYVEEFDGADGPTSGSP